MQENRTMTVKTKEVAKAKLNSRGNFQRRKRLLRGQVWAGGDGELLVCPTTVSGFNLWVQPPATVRFWTQQLAVSVVGFLP